jgi:hypothetical protein
MGAKVKCHPLFIFASSDALAIVTDSETMPLGPWPVQPANQIGFVHGILFFDVFETPSIPAF